MEHGTRKRYSNRTIALDASIIKSQRAAGPVSTGMTIHSVRSWRLILLAFLFCGRAVCADDWPQWGGLDLGRNMVSTEKDLPETFKARSPTENVRWVVKLGTAIQGNPTVSGGKVFVGTDDAVLEEDSRFTRTHGGMVQCLDEATGRVALAAGDPSAHTRPPAAGRPLWRATPWHLFIPGRRRKSPLLRDRCLRDHVSRYQRYGRRQRRAV